MHIIYKRLPTNRQKYIKCQIYGFLCDLNTDLWPAGARHQRSNEVLVRSCTQGRGAVVNPLRHFPAEKHFSLRPKHVPFVFCCLYYHVFLLMNKLTVSNASLSHLSPGLRLWPLHPQPDEMAAGKGIKSFFPSGWEGAPASSNCKCAFFPLVIFCFPLQTAVATFEVGESKSSTKASHRCVAPCSPWLCWASRGYEAPTTSSSLHTWSQEADFKSAELWIQDAEYIIPLPWYKKGAPYFHFFSLF